MKDDYFEPIPVGALLALVLGSLASAVLTVGTAATFLMALMLTAGEARAAPPDPALVARGRYLVQTAGCNDCHTPGYAEAGGKVPEQAWLTGDRLGWRGPWGTSYATNLRLRLAEMSRDEWLRYARAMQPRPPMPWFNVRAMSDQDLTAIWAWVKAMGPAGEPAPQALPPGQAPVGPVVMFPQ
jgi:cytochrome c553